MEVMGWIVLTMMAVSWVVILAALIYRVVDDRRARRDAHELRAVARRYE